MNDTDWYGPDMATFGDRLAAAREAAGQTQAQLAKQLGVKEKTVASWENDTSEPRANRISMLAGLVNVSVMWLLNGEGEGLDAPADGSDIPEDVQAALVEMRTIQSNLIKQAHRLGVLEKKIRKSVLENA